MINWVLTTHSVQWLSRVSARLNQLLIFPTGPDCLWFQEIILLSYRSVQIRIILCVGSDAPEYEPPQKMIRYRMYYSTQLAFLFPPDQCDRAEMFCIC